MLAAGYTDFACADGHTCDSTMFENGEGSAALGGVIAPAIIDGGVWCATNFDGLPLAFCVSDTIGLGVPGDVDLDGDVTLADLLLLHKKPLPSPEASDALRAHLLSLNRPSR